MQSKQTLASIFHFLQLTSGKKSIFLFCFIIFLNGLAALLEGLSFSLILLALTALAVKEFTLPSLLQGFFIHYSQQQLFLIFFSGAIGSQLMRSFLHYVAQMEMTKLAAKIQREAQKKIYAQIFRFSYPYASQYKAGDLVEHVNGPLHFCTHIMDGLNRFMISLFMMAASLFVMFMLSPLLTIMCLIFFCVAGFFQRFILRKIAQASAGCSETLVSLSKNSVQSLNSIKAIHIYNRQAHILEEASKTLGEMSAATKRINLWNHFIQPLNETLGILLVAGCLLAGSILLKNGELPLLPVLLTFLTLTYRFSTRLQSFMQTLGTFSYYKGHLDRFSAILNDHDKEFLSETGKEFADFSDHIAFKNVSFCYPGRKEYAIQNLSLAIRKGSVTALVGHSGAGKTSILELLVRLYEPSEGSLFVDGVSLTQYNLKSWRNRLGVVSQDAIIFNETIAENIRFGSEAPLKKIEEAAQLAGIHSFILSLPKQYETVVGERGYRLSGGERQRLALARALVKDPKILILDEATSSLDSESEHLIQEALETFRGRKTMIIVAHRLSTIAEADEIFVLDKGQLIEKGRHENLLQLGGRYQLFWNLQTKKL